MSDKKERRIQAATRNPRSLDEHVLGYDDIADVLLCIAVLYVGG